MVDIYELFQRIDSKLDQILKELKTMSSTVSENFLKLQAQVATNTTVEASAVTLIQGLSAELATATAAAANGDTAALPALQAQLDQSATALAAAVAANTVAAPAPAPSSSSGSTSSTTPAASS